MKTDELTITGLIFSGIVLTGMWLQSHHQTNKQLLSLQDSYFEAMHTAIEIDTENISLHDAIIELNNYATELEDLIYSEELVKLIKIKEDLRSYSIEERATALALAWTESSWRLNPYHNDDGFTKGPCGVKKYHIEYLADKNINRYSFASCIEMYKLYKYKNSGSKDKAIKEYKGIVTKTYLVGKYNNIRDKILKILKE